MVIVEVATSVFFAPFFILLFVIILLASLGKSFGIRKLYVDLLLKLFEVRKKQLFRNRFNEISNQCQSSDKKNQKKRSSDHKK